MRGSASFNLRANGVTQAYRRKLFGRVDGSKFAEQML